MRIKRVCGDVSTFPFKLLCPACLNAASTSLCVSCEGYARPLPPCPLEVSCRDTYDWDAGGERVTVPCGYCGMRTEVWGSPKVLVGRWIRREKEIGVDALGIPIVERKSIPAIRSVDACPVCADLWNTYRTLWRLAEKRGPCFLPL